MYRSRIQKMASAEDIEGVAEIPLVLFVFSLIFLLHNMQSFKQYMILKYTKSLEKDKTSFSRFQFSYFLNITDYQGSTYHLTLRLTCTQEKCPHVLYTCLDHICWTYVKHVWNICKDTHMFNMYIFHMFNTCLIHMLNTCVKYICKTCVL